MRSLPFGSPRDLSAAIRYARTRVTATVFADRTGDARLETFRTMAADWVARPRAVVRLPSTPGSTTVSHPAMYRGSS